LLLAATAWNLKKWMKFYFYSIFIGEIKLIKEYYLRLSSIYKQFVLLLIIKVNLILHIN